MKFILLILTVSALLATTGCIFFPGHRERVEDRGHPGGEHHDDHPSGVDHGEHPGDMDHQENR